MRKIASILCLSIVFNSFGVEQLIRDVSPLPYVPYSTRSVFRVIRLAAENGHHYKDKLAIMEFEHSNGFVMAFLWKYLLPDEWDVFAGVRRVHYMDPLDALTLAALDGNVEIATAAVNILPLSKFIVETGKTTDYKNKPVTAEPINADHYLTLAFDAVENFITASRATKTTSLCSAGLAASAIGLLSLDVPEICKASGTALANILGVPLSCGGNRANARNSTPVPQEKPQDSKQAGAPDKKDAATQTDKKSWFSPTKVSLLSGGFFALLAWRMHQKQTHIVRAYLSVIDFLLKSPKLTFSKSYVLQRLIKLHDNVRLFGLGQETAQYLKKITSSIL